MLLPVLLLLLLLASLLVPEANGEDRSRKDFWIGRYGEIREGRLVSRGREVFSRVLAAADRRAGLEPSFHILSYDGLPWAQSLADGSILLTRKAVEFCYGGRSPEEGDARLAFVLGHELAHLLNGDFWEYRFLRSASDGKGGVGAFQGVRSVARNSDLRLARELQADQYGVIYAALAGFDSDIVVSEDKSFFRQWAENMMPDDTARKELATFLDRREKAVALRLKEVSEKVVLFKMGVVSAKVGRHDDALLLFRRFASEFPGREVYGNIGTVLLGRAYESFLASRAPESFPYILLFGVESRTRAELIDVGRGFTEEKFRDFKSTLGEAVASLEKAIGYDPFYAAARNGLGCARMLEKRYYDAISVLEQALKLAPEDDRIAGNLAVGCILLGQELGSEALLERAEMILKPLSARNSAARANRNAFFRSRGMQTDGGYTIEFGREDSTNVIQPPTGYRKEFRPPANLPANHALAVVDEVVEGGTTIKVYSDVRRSVALLVRNGAIRLALYRSPPRLPRGASAWEGEEADAFLSLKGRNGYLLAGKRAREYFEF